MKKYRKNFPQKLTVETMYDCYNGCWNGCYTPVCYGQPARATQETLLLDTYQDDFQS